MGDVDKKHRCLNNRLFYIGKVKIDQELKLYKSSVQLLFDTKARGVQL